MTIKRYVAANSREAMSLVRRELGDEAIILSNKRSGDNSVEILACGPDAVDAFVDRAAAREAEPAPAAARSEPETFEDYLRRRGAAAPRASVAPALSLYDDVAAAEHEEEPAPPRRATVPLTSSITSPLTSPITPVRPAALLQPLPAAPRQPAPRPEPRAAVRREPVVEPVVEPLRRAAPSRDDALLAEVHAMRSLLEGQLQALTMNEAQRRHPVQAQLMTRLLTAGFSPKLARDVASRAPADRDAKGGDEWLAEVLARNLRCAGNGESLFECGGVFALVGPTGVGKTTTVAKLAARFAVRHGADSLGLITLDSYRIGAHEQLRTYGRILGVPVHLAQDGETLAELLDSMQHKKLVLIDSCGVSQRDQRLGETIRMLDELGVRRVLMLNAASHAETLEDVARAWRASECAGAILTKLDEAVRIGGAVDVVLRHKLMLMGLTNGQRVPEDWHAAKASVLTHLALKPGAANFVLEQGEAALLAQASFTMREAVHV
ncbi:MAG: flagellar biosynthesis protein FlhF [Burkholderiaceae bacterium]